MARRGAARPLGTIFAISVLVAASGAGAAAAEVYCKHYEGPTGACLLRGGNELWPCNPPTDGKCYTTHEGDRYDCVCMTERPRPALPQRPAPKPVPEHPLEPQPR
jgi:hypothetical protein